MSLIRRGGTIGGVAGVGGGGSTRSKSLPLTSGSAGKPGKMLMIFPQAIRTMIFPSVITGSPAGKHSEAVLVQWIESPGLRNVEKKHFGSDSVVIRALSQSKP